MGLTPIVIHERAHNGTTVQQTVYPYALVRYKGRMAVVSLLQNNRGMSGEENLNASIENLEYAFAEAIHQVQQTEVPKVAFLEGHGELPEQNVYVEYSPRSLCFGIFITWMTLLSFIFLRSSRIAAWLRLRKFIR